MFWNKKLSSSIHTHSFGKYSNLFAVDSATAKQARVCETCGIIECTAAIQLYESNLATANRVIYTKD